MLIIERNFNGRRSLFAVAKIEDWMRGEPRIVTKLGKLAGRATIPHTGRKVKVYPGENGKTYQVYSDGSAREVG